MGISLMESRRRILLNTPHIEAVSGDIATFSTDMAAPLKSCVVTINPVQEGSGDPSPDNIRPISGWGAVNAWRTGKNLLEISPNTYSSSGGANAEYLYNGVRVYNTIAGVYKYTAWKFLVGSLVGQTLRFSCDCEGTGRRVLARFYYADNTPAGSTLWERTEAHVDRGITIPATLPPDAYLRIGFYCTENVSAIGEVTYTNIQLELGSTATAYYPYTGTTYPITIPTPPGTVYGGTLDLRTGVLTVTWTCHTFDGVSRKASSLAQVSATSDFTYVRGLYNVILDDLPNDFPYNNSGNRLSSHFLWWTYSARQNVKPDNICFTTSGRVVRWYSSTYTTLQEFNDYLADQYALGTPVQLVYQLPTPVTYQLSPQQLSTIKGVNNIWADCGPVNIKYWTH